MAGNRRKIQDSATATGNGEPFGVMSFATTVFQIIGTFTATITFEASLNGTDWRAVQVANMGDGTVGTTATTEGLYTLSTAGLGDVRARISSYTDGTVTVWARGVTEGSSMIGADIDISGSEDVNVTDRAARDLGKVDVAGIDAVGSIAGQKAMAASIPVTIASDQSALTVNATLGAGVAAIGKLAANTGVDIGDVDVLSLPNVTIATLPAAVQGPGNPTVDSFSHAVVDLAASTTNQSLVAAPGAGKQIWVYGLFMMADTAAGTVTLQDEDDTALSGTMAVSDEGGWVLPMSGNFAMPWIKVPTAKALEADTGACTVDGVIVYGVVTL